MIDKPGVTVDRVDQQLARRALVVASDMFGVGSVGSVVAACSPAAPHA